MDTGLAGSILNTGSYTKQWKAAFSSLSSGITTMRLNLSGFGGRPIATGGPGASKETEFNRTSNLESKRQWEGSEAVVFSRDASRWGQRVPVVNPP